ncbi:glutathione S-transferase theta-1-like [Neocloeon triangulifer]|uniref:glutathione S-transferase theta-1-like n=1 Tax=Neocloeon triangulifer TaxID=2078957 RepID=UPI00286FAA89|nr:glutathione S-transferase theta-1-like [Neocloeon triangulifer]
MSLKLYYNLMSQPSRALYIFLKKNHINFEAKSVNLAKGEQRSKEFKANVNAFGLVPAIDHNGFKLTESVAILRYFCRENNVPDHWYPKDSKLQARVDEYLEWQHLNTRAHCFLYVREKILLPILSGRPPNKHVIKQRLAQMNETLDKIENIWLRDRPFLAGDKISIADLLGACEIEQPRMVHYNPGLNRPKLAAWMQRVKSELSPHYEDAHKIIGTTARYMFVFDAYCVWLRFKNLFVSNNKK